MVLLAENAQTSSILKRFVGDIGQFVGRNPLLSGVALGGLGTITAVQVTRLVGKRRKKKATTRRKSTRKRTKSGRKTTKKVRKKNGTLRKHRTPPAKSRIRFTKNGQPFIITRSGKAKFIKKTSAQRAKKLKGGFK